MIRERIEHIVKEPFYIGTKQVYKYSYYEDYAQYLFYDKNGWVIATITSDRELTEEEIIKEFSDFDTPTKRKEFMW